MSIGSCVSLTFTAVLAFTLLLSSPARADRAKDAGPEDGILCCSGLGPFLFQGDKVMVVTGRAGIFRSESRGEIWTRSMDGLVGQNGVAPFADYICQSLSQTNVVYAIAGLGGPLSTLNGIFSSDDFGKTWTLRGQVDTGFGFNICAVDADEPRTVYVFGFDSTTFEPKTWRSTDGGQTNVDISGSVPACALGGFVVPVPGKVYMTGTCVVVSTDGGASFQSVPTPPGLVGSFAVSPDGHAIFMNMHDASFNPLGTFRSTDGGASYLPVSGLLFGISLPLGFDPTDESRIYDADGFTLKVSRDGGLSFTATPNAPPGPGPFLANLVGVATPTADCWSALSIRRSSFGSRGTKASMRSARRSSTRTASRSTPPRSPARRPIRTSFSRPHRSTSACFAPPTADKVGRR